MLVTKRKPKSLHLIMIFTFLTKKSLLASKFLIRSLEREKLLEVNKREVATLVDRLKSGDFMESVMNFMSKKSKL